MEVDGESLAGQEVAVLLAAETGTVQPMYSVGQYERVNGLGRANLIEWLVNNRDRSANKIVVASSRAIYGEGKYHCATHGVVYPGERLPQAMESGQFEPTCPIVLCHARLYQLTKALQSRRLP